MTLSLTYDFKGDVAEVVPLGLDHVGDPTIKPTIPDTAAVVTDLTSPAVSMQWLDTRTMAGTSETLDLTSLASGNLPTKNATGKKLRFIKVKAAVGNTDVIRIKAGAANPYQVWGNAGSDAAFGPGEINQRWCADAMAAVSATVKNIDVSSLTAGQSYSIQLVFG